MAVEPADLSPRPEAAREQLAGRYGHVAHEVLRARRRLAEPVVAGRPDLLAEAAYAARREQARTVGDVLLRRTRLGLTAARVLLAPGAAAIARVAAAMGAELGWDEARRAREVEAFREEAARRGHPARTVTFRRPRRLRPGGAPRPGAALPRRLIVLADRRLRARPGRVRAGRLVPAAPIDGPKPRSSALGDVDVARDGTGGVVYLSATAASRRSSSRACAAAPGARPSAWTRGRLGTEVAVAAGDGGRLAVAWIAGGRCSRPSPRAAARRAPRAAVADRRPGRRRRSTSTWASTGPRTRSGSRPATSRAARLAGSDLDAGRGAAGHRPGARGRDGRLRPRVAV